MPSITASPILILNPVLFTKVRKYPPEAICGNERKVAAIQKFSKKEILILSVCRYIPLRRVAFV